MITPTIIIRIYKPTFPTEILDAGDGSSEIKLRATGFKAWDRIVSA